MARRESSRDGNTEEWNMKLNADDLKLEKENNAGCWLLSYRPHGATMVLELHIQVGGPWDIQSFRAELHVVDTPPRLLGAFDIAPIEILVTDAPRYVEGVAEPWNPEDDPAFQALPSEHRETVGAMVWHWGRLLGALVPAPA
jgi:hypothetical protein